MNKKNKILIITLIFVSLSIFAAACGGSGGSSSGESPSPGDSENGNVSDGNVSNNSNEQNDAEKSDLDYPKKPVEIIVPYDAGGGQDIAARTFAKYLEENLGQRVIVQNVTGGGGVVGHTEIADADPDGYTIGIIHTFTAVDQFTLEGIPYTEKDFLPVAMIAADPHVLVAKQDLGIDNFNDFIDHVKSNPGAVTIGMGGPWNGHDFFRINLENATDTQFERVVFQGGAPALTAVAGGNIDSATPFVAEAMAQVDVGSVVPLAVTSDERSNLLPDVPTVKEMGYDVTQYMWRGFAVPAETPMEIVEYLEDAFTKTFENPEYQEEAEQAGISLSFKGHEEFQEYYSEEFEKYKSMIEEIGLEPQKQE